MASFAAAGKKALDASQYDEAIKQYTSAIKSSPTSPDYYIQRATAHQRAGNYSQALDDAENGVVNAETRAKREFIIEAQFRRGCALYSLGRHGDADFVLGIVKKMKHDHKQASMWANKAQMALAKLAEDDQKRKITVTETPDLSAPRTSVSFAKAGNNADASTTTPAQTTQSPTVQQTPADRIRQEWYQSTTSVYFTLIARGVPREQTQVDITERSLTLSFPLITGSSYDLTLDPLFAAVDPSKCITRILPSKVEIVLAKAVPGQKWSALESSEPLAEASTSAPTNGDEAVKRAVFTDHNAKAPAYPTSSKSGPKDWDKITTDLRKAEREKEGKSKSTGDDDDDEFEGGDEANGFFKKLYAGASPEVQRAMMKSYTESNGTALSTNWDEVGKKKVETSPPDGMVAKKW